MARRFGWAPNGGVALGDVAAALAGKSFGDAPAPATAFSPAKIVIDCAQGENFKPTLKTTAATVHRIGAPINYAEGSEVTLVLTSSSTIGTVVFTTSASSATYVLASATFTLVASKTRCLNFKYVASLNKFVENWRTPIAGF
jgi:hypothetical protein